MGLTSQSPATPLQRLCNPNEALQNILGLFLAVPPRTELYIELTRLQHLGVLLNTCRLNKRASNTQDPDQDVGGSFPNDILTCLKQQLFRFCR
jgi:hypothetical protein